ncbi:hypothetical protein SMD44_00608 [Streptomyces alboflavus]|uniref:Uncharacterized protein n=1 Tax=Streptomyces alboflavus TaxID=67267 RepID=A0A1Z1W485_9ACTN|nr:hypothetical protein SMD44_00608 [Streptomyces alboflavus]
MDHSLVDPRCGSLLDGMAAAASFGLFTPVRVTPLAALPVTL